MKDLLFASQTLLDLNTGTIHHRYVTYLTNAADNSHSYLQHLDGGHESKSTGHGSTRYKM